MLRFDGNVYRDDEGSPFCPSCYNVNWKRSPMRLSTHTAGNQKLEIWICAHCELPVYPHDIPLTPFSAASSNC